MKKNFAFLAAAAIWFAAATVPGTAEKLKVGSTSTGIPFTFLDVQTNKIQGVMVDMIQEVAKRVDLQVEIEPTDWPSLIPALNSNKIDIISAAMAITEERSKEVSFADPIYSYGAGLVVKKGNPKNLHQIEDLKDANVGTQIGQAFLSLAKERGIEFKLYNSNSDLLRDLNLGRVDAGVVDHPQGAYVIDNNSEYDLEFVEGFKPFATHDLSFAVRKDEGPLLEKLNEGIAQLKKDGGLQMIIDKWNLKVTPAP